MSYIAIKIYVVKYEPNFSSVFAPIPLTSVNCSIDSKAPFCSLYSKIDLAFEGPMPGTVNSSGSEAVLIFIFS